MRPAVPALPGQTGQAPQLASVIRAKGRELSNLGAMGSVVWYPPPAVWPPFSAHRQQLLLGPPPSQLRVQTSRFSNEWPASLGHFTVHQG